MAYPKGSAQLVAFFLPRSFHIVLEQTYSEGDKEEDVINSSSSKTRRPTDLYSRIFKVLLSEKKAHAIHQARPSFHRETASKRGIPGSVSLQILFMRLVTVPKVHHLCPVAGRQIFPCFDGPRGDDDSSTSPAMDGGLRRRAQY